MQKNPKSNKPAQTAETPALKRVRKSVYKQALLAGLLILLTVVILFAATAAWYTNIVQTSGLMFEAAAWGFDGTVTLDGDAIRAAPGEDGVIPLTAKSDSDMTTAVGVNISKENMSPVEMQQRIFFYADTQKSRSGEIMERVYLNNTENYTYTIFSKGTLNLTEPAYNDAQLKWEWVYDVLGYYVQGTWNEETKTMAIADYLRPIEYEYDEAATTFQNGVLTTVDGTTTAAEFLYTLSLTDGYAGTIDASQRNGGGYYPVAVDGNGTGVWAYLCSYSEISSNTLYDTNLGNGTTEIISPFTATITISAQNTDVAVTEVQTPAALAEAVSSAGSSGQQTVIRLTDNMALTDALKLDGKQQIMLDLDGHTLQVPSGTYAGKAGGIQMTAGSSLTVTGGTLQGAGGTGHVVTASGAEITLSNVTVENAECALYVRDDNGSADSLIRLVGCNITTDEEAVYLSGNGSASAQKTRLIVENTTIDSEYIGIMGNGNSSGTGQWGTDVQIINSTVDGYWAGIYQPQKNSVLTISNGSTITGYTGMALKGGAAYVLDSTVSGTGAAADTPSITGSGFTDTADGIYIESGYGYEIVLEVRNSTVTSAAGQAIQVYEPDARNVSVTVNGGNFSSDVSGVYPESTT